jgi:stage V sporulation protein R
MTQKALRPSELIDYADHHSGTMASGPGRINPYKVGIELFRDIEERWNKGQFGPEWEACDDVRVKEEWDKQVGLGRQKVFEVRKIYNDVGFIDAFLTEDFARRHKLFTYRYDKQTRQYRIDSRDFEDIKRMLLFQLTNFGQPVITVEDANYNNRGELYLRHHHEGVDLHTGYAVDTLANVAAVWQRPVHVETTVEGEGRILFSHDGREPERTRLDK